MRSILKPALWSCALSGAGLIGCSADVAPVVDPTPQSGGSANTSGSGGSTGGGFGKFGSGGTSSPSGGAFGSGVAERMPGGGTEGALSSAKSESTLSPSLERSGWLLRAGRHWWLRWLRWG